MNQHDHQREDWIEDLRHATLRRHLSTKTFRTYLYGIKRLVDHIDKHPRDCDLNEIHDFQVKMADEQATAYSTYRITCCAIRFLYKEVYPKTWIVDKIPYPKKDVRLPTVLAQSEVRSLVMAIDHFEVRAIIQLIYATGMRIGEALGLKPGHIDRARKRIRVVSGKGRKDRELPMSPTVLRLLEAIARYQRDQLGFNPNYLFPGRGGKTPKDERLVSKHLKPALVRAGITKRVTAHTLRHSFATHQLEHGINIRQLQKLLGHKSLKTTLIYVHLVEEQWALTPCLLQQLRKKMQPKEVVS